MLNLIHKKTNAVASFFFPFSFASFHLLPVPEGQVERNKVQVYSSIITSHLLKVPAATKTKNNLKLTMTITGNQLLILLCPLHAYKRMVYITMKYIFF